MLTLTPPETREDEIQVDETERDSILLRMSPTRARKNAHGFNYIQLIVGMIIFVALSRIVGPPAFRMITRARSTALDANIQTAAETVRNVLAIDPAKRGTPTAGVPQATFIAALTDDAPFAWQPSWLLPDDADSNTIYVQFINKGTTITAAPIGGTTQTPPTVEWLLNPWDAVRLQARNQDGAWACALVVLKPNTAGMATPPTDTALTDAQLRGVWYDSGPSYPDAQAAATEVNKQGAQHCSPVLYDATTPTDPLPTSASDWTIGTYTMERGV